jgi:DNA-binding transcriptional MerR regulator
MGDDLMLSADAARLLGITPSSVRIYAVRGKLPFRATAGGVRIFRRGDVERLKRERDARRAAEASATR